MSRTGDYRTSGTSETSETGGTSETSETGGTSETSGTSGTGETSKTGGRLGKARKAERTRMSVVKKLC